MKIIHILITTNPLHTIGDGGIELSLELRKQKGLK